MNLMHFEESDRETPIVFNSIRVKKEEETSSERSNEENMIRSSNSIRNLTTPSVRTVKKTNIMLSDDEADDNEELNEDEVPEEVEIRREDNEDDGFIDNRTLYDTTELVDHDKDPDDDDDDNDSSSSSSDKDDENDEEEKGKWGKKDKKTRKICRHFGYDLIIRAMNQSSDIWETEQITELLLLIIEEMDMKSFQIKKMIEKTRIGKPSLLTALADKGFIFSISEITSILLNCSSNIFEYIRLIDECLEMDLFLLDDLDTINIVSCPSFSSLFSLLSALFPLPSSSLPSSFSLALYLYTRKYE
jgi:hypothetical protein